MDAEEVIRLPSVQLIGAQKAGTSAIADWLFQEGSFRRPSVFEGEPGYYDKEVHFFDDGRRYNQGVQFYAKRFPPSNRTIDCTPDTLQFASRVRFTYEKAGGNQAKTVKIIVILRDPVSRELSLYNHLVFECSRLGPRERNQWHNQAVREDGEIMTFDEFVEERSIPALGRETGIGRSTRHSLYATNLSKWFEKFDRNQILVLSYKELRESPARLQQRIQDFLGFSIPGQLKHSNSLDGPHKVKTASREAASQLNAAFAPWNDQLYHLLESNPGPTMEQRPFPRF